METATLETKVLDAAEALFYGRGLQTVGMDQIRSASGVSLKRLYQLFPSKDTLVLAYLHRRDERWRAELTRQVAAVTEAPRERILAVYDWLDRWFREPDFRGCAFVNSFGELGAASEPVAEAARAHKAAFRDWLSDLVAAAGLPEHLTDQLFLLAEGAITTAAVSGGPEPARQAREAARALMDAAG
ncbi:TetR/AcrR family transcriptional regulator [Streptomyces sp. SAJ15]|uniref:TetR/AcrR family transcriptional regulator n=1 Tax=Streptomyces sp. SAJ15 TaxID=2011095 RepID=UPI00118662BC|nr:TetR/AcrR family transcriptional regulator [Streptomyces sp. SAJ15]TVL90546.1 TetR family transcriptional regulator [Streptomyces sp. SAJ15]